MNIGLTYDLKTDYSLKKGESEDTLAEFDPPETIKDLEEALIGLGHKVIKIGRAEKLLKALNKLSVDMVFNLAEGNYGRNRESWVPVILELKKIPFLGSDASILGICLDKLLTKKLLVANGISTPDFRGIDSLDNLKKLTLKFPIIVKPRYEGSSKGISVKSIVKNKKELISRVKFILNKYKQPALVEEFIKGSEFTVAIIGNNHPEVMPIVPRAVDMDTTLSTHVLDKDTTRVRSSKIKEATEITPELEKNLKHLALKTYQVLDCFDFARIDFRVDERNNPFVLEVNPLPNLSKDDSFGLLAEYLNISYKDLINKILKAGIKRLGINEKR